MLKQYLHMLWAFRVVKWPNKHLPKTVFNSQVNGLIAIGDNKSDKDCAPAIKVCAFPCDEVIKSEKENHIKCVKNYSNQDIFIKYYSG